MQNFGNVVDKSSAIFGMINVTSRQGRPHRRWIDEVTQWRSSEMRTLSKQANYMATFVQSAIDSHVRTQAQEADDVSDFFKGRLKMQE